MPKKHCLIIPLLDLFAKNTVSREPFIHCVYTHRCTRQKHGSHAEPSIRTHASFLLYSNYSVTEIHLTYFPRIEQVLSAVWNLLELLIHAATDRRTEMEKNVNINRTVLKHLNPNSKREVWCRLGLKNIYFIGYTCLTSLCHSLVIIHKAFNCLSHTHSRVLKSFIFFNLLSNTCFF